MSGSVRLEWDARGVATVTIDRPLKRNALSSEVMQALVSVMLEVSATDGLRVVVLTGAGGHAFAGGADLHELAALDESSARAFITRVHQCCRACIECPVPVLARIDGYALGAGLELAAACDLRIATGTATFAMPEVKLGLPSVVEAALLPRLIGAGRARWLVYTGASIDAPTALSWGLVNEVVGRDELEQAVNRTLGLLLANGPHAMRAQKALCTAWDERPLAEVIDGSVEVFARTWLQPEARERLSAFLASRNR